MSATVETGQTEFDVAEPEPEPEIRVEWAIPGSGERGPDCGTYRPVGVCENGHADYSIHNCSRRSCPRCRARWTHRAAVSVTERVQGRRLREPPDFHRQTGHAIYSPPKDAYGRSMAEIRRLRSDAAAYLTDRGFRGLVLFVHPWRLNDSAKRAYARAETELKAWMWLIKESDMAWREAVEWGPHVHAIGLMSPDMDPREGDDGAYYELKRTFGPLGSYQDYDSHEGVYGLARYLLSHVSFPTEYTGQAYTYHGELANNKFVENATQEWQTEQPHTMQNGELELAIRRAIGDTPDDEFQLHHDCCQRDGCNAEVVPLKELDRYIREHNPPPDVLEVMVAVDAWADSKSFVEPPASAKHPRSIKEFDEAVEALIGGHESGPTVGNRYGMDGRYYRP